MLFEPAVESSLPKGLELFPALVDVPAGASEIHVDPNPESHNSMAYSYLQKHFWAALQKSEASYL